MRMGRSLPWAVTITIVAWTALSPLRAAGTESRSGDDPSLDLDGRCLVSPNHGLISTTGVLGHGCIDGWGEYSITPDPGSPRWDISRDCSIRVDWESLLGRRLHVEGTAFLMSGGIAGGLGDVMGVARIELLPSVVWTTWGRVRATYR